MRIAVFGDSHAEALFAAYPSIDIYWVGPVTMHRIGRDGIESLLVPRWGFSRIAKHGLREYDHVLLSFGEIDCRVHVPGIAEKNSVPTHQVMEDLAERYVAAIQKYFGRSGIPVVLCVPPVTPYADTVEQKDLRDRFNASLAGKCSEHEIAFLDYRESASLVDRCLAEGSHDGNVHFEPRATGFLASHLARITSFAVRHDPSYQRQPDRLQKHRTVRSRLKHGLLRLFGQNRVT
ncbi:hypothetical protein [Hoeflea sp.]|uniref:hypothetical protein n=1 Tax=Hoeflea sp. TaxID=1940281 RepID=UPI0019C8FAA6|nr:hypothetical protein [Hoeflea sp.]MBC7282930.1 SGNH/GDSL hydrolase family protein [Hoeflea sp.]